MNAYVVIKHQIFVTEDEDEFRESEIMAVFGSEEAAEEFVQEQEKIRDNRLLTTIFGIEEHELQ